jgi:hypothetical protein
MAEIPAKRQKVDDHRQASGDLSFEDFAPDGDLIFIVQGETPVRVYSDVMKRASSVFAAMLGPKFKEGHALAEASGAPIEIPLPEDDSEPFGWICRALHCQASTKLWEPTTNQLATVWTLIHKYDLKDVMQLSLSFWTGKRVYWEAEIRELWLLAQISLANEDNDSFTAVTRKLILNTSASIYETASTMEENPPIIEGRLVYKLAGMSPSCFINSRQQNTNSYSTGAIQQTRDSAIIRTAKFLYSALPRIIQTCSFTTHSYFAQLVQLSTRLDGPPIPATVLDTTTYLDSYTAIISGLIEWTTRPACNCGGHRCADNMADMRRDIQSFLKPELAYGLCLDCFDGPECPTHGE